MSLSQKPTLFKGIERNLYPYKTRYWETCKWIITCRKFQVLGLHSNNGTRDKETTIANAYVVSIFANSTVCRLFFLYLEVPISIKSYAQMYFND